MKKGKTGKNIFHTQGIANAEPDPPITESQIIGTIMFKIPVLSHIAKVMHNLYSFYFIIFLPMVVLICLELRKIIVHFVKKDEDENEDEEL